MYLAWEVQVLIAGKIFRLVAPCDGIDVAPFPCPVSISAGYAAETSCLKCVLRWSFAGFSFFDSSPALYFKFASIFRSQQLLSKDSRKDQERPILKAGTSPFRAIRSSVL